MGEIPIPENMSQIVAQRPVRRAAYQPYMPVIASEKRAQAGAFLSLSQEGMRWFGLLKGREAEDQFNQARANTLEAFNTYNQWLRDNPDTADTDLVKFEEIMGGSQKENERLLTNGVAAREFEFWVKPQKIAMSDRAAETAFKINTENKYQQMLSRFSEALIDAAIITDEEGKPVLDEQGKTKYDWNRAKDIVTDPSVLKELGIPLKEADAMLEDVMSQISAQQKREDAVSDQRIRSQFYQDIDGIMTQATTKEQVLADLKVATEGDYTDPKNPIDPTISQADGKAIEKAIHTEYQQAYAGAMSKVAQHARGMLLNPDSLGYIKNAPIRYKTLSDFQQAWHQYLADKGDKLKISEIYPDGVRLAAMHQISDEEAERQEIEMNKMLRRREGVKEEGFLGVLQLKGGGVATEYSFGTTDVTGREMDIPSLVPTLTKKEIKLMTDDIIPNRKSIPDEIKSKAIAHAKKRIDQGKSVFAEAKPKAKKEKLPPNDLTARERMELIDFADMVDDETRRELELIVETGDVKLIRKAMARLRGAFD